MAARSATTFDIVVSPPADTTAPTVTSIVRQTPTSSPTNADSLTWRVTFSEAVSNVDTADFAVNGTTATLSVSAVSGVTYDVTSERGQPGQCHRHGHPVHCRGPRHSGRGDQCADQYNPHGHERQELCRGQHRPDGGDHRSMTDDERLRRSPRRSPSRRM